MKFAFVFRLCALLLVTAGVMAQLRLFEGRFSGATLVYYTTQSNLLALVLFAMLTVRTAMALRAGDQGSAGFFARFEMVCVVDLLVTLIVFWTLLAPGMPGLAAPRNLAVHLVTPLLCLLDYVVFVKAQHLKYRDVYLTAVFPVAYLAFALVVAATGYTYDYRTDETGARVPIHYPYNFLDFDKNGMMTLVYAVGLLIGVLLMAHAFYLLDKRRENLQSAS